MRHPGHTMLSIMVLVALILTVTVTGALAQPPALSGGRYTIEFRNECRDLAACPDTRSSIQASGTGDALDDIRQTATITIVKNADPADGTDFDFTSDLIGFTLDDADPDDGDAVWDDITFQEVPAAVPLDFFEVPPTFWELVAMACSYSNGETNIDFISDGGSFLGLTIDAAEGDHVRCTFYNEQVPLYLIYAPFVSQGETAP